MVKFTFIAIAFTIIGLSTCQLFNQPEAGSDLEDLIEQLQGNFEEALEKLQENIGNVGNPNGGNNPIEGINSNDQPPFNFLRPNLRRNSDVNAKFFFPPDFWCRLPFPSDRICRLSCSGRNQIGGYCQDGRCVCVEQTTTTTSTTTTTPTPPLP